MPIGHMPDRHMPVSYTHLTGVDALAVSIGTVHGILPKGYVPKLQLGLLKELAAAVPVPLVLHGGSGTPHDEVGAACRTGIRKVNISSEFKHAYYQSVREFVTNHPTLVSPTPVSYTHLDVYKRQGVWRQSRPQLP